MFWVEDQDEGSQTELIGTCEYDLGALLQSPNQQFEHDIVDQGKPQGKIFVRYKYVDDADFNESGKSSVPSSPHMLHFLKSGWKFSMNFAIDLTGSNGDPKTESSLHYFTKDKRQLNQYESAIWAVGNVIEQYDNDKRFPVIGFGAILPEKIKQREVCHNISLGEAVGVQGVLDNYWGIFDKGIKLYGPTLFHHFLDQFITWIEAKGPIPEYNVILILTDGMIHDMDETKHQLVRASFLPISIIIVGIGNSEELDNMWTLDADKEPFKDMTGRPAGRDIVQFVRFNDFKHNGELLAEEVLKEIPT